jgi:FkbH-like protein
VPPPFRFAICASFTAEPIQPVIELWGRRLDSDVEIRFAPYNQPLQTLLDPASVFGANQHGINVLLLRLEDAGEPRRMEADANELARVALDSAARFSVPLLVCLCPSSPEFLADAERARKARDVSGRLEGMFQDAPGVQFLAAGQIERLYPVEAPHDPDAERLGAIPYTELYFCALGTAVVRHAHALLTPPYKVIALDCDNTLWQGICGEDGPSGIVVDPPRRALQEFMLEQREAGVLLAMNSKNNEQDVLETFGANPQMPLQLRHFVAWRLNWESKADNLASLAAELNLGLDAFAFVDDSPKECAEVAGNDPEVLVLPLPSDITRTPDFLNHVWAFDHPAVTEEDRNRSAYYSQAQEFGREIKRATNLEEFIAGLGLEVTFSPLTQGRLSRAAQLTQRTNQFNFTTVRRSESELTALLAGGACECVTVEVEDRFGSYGVVGVIVYTAGAALEIDTFLLSCRVLGRGVEHRMMRWLGEEAGRRGLSTVVARLRLTAKNKPAQRFLQAIGGGETVEYRFDAAALRRLRWTPASAVEAPGPASEPARRSTRRLIDYASIANELATPAQILEAMRRAHVPSARQGMTDVERRVADIWSDLLKRPAIAVSDNFFDLGGHSLLAILLILRVREAFGVELPIDDVYSATLTLGELARKIEAYQSSEANPEEYEALLAEIDALSDEEVQALLSSSETEAAPR